jgi:hypothetical protein
MFRPSFLFHPPLLNDIATELAIFVMTMFSFRVSHTVMLWFCLMVMLTFLSSAAVFLPFLLPLPSYCSPSTCPAGWRPWLIPSWVWLLPICFFFCFLVYCGSITLFYKSVPQKNEISNMLPCTQVSVLYGQQSRMPDLTCPKIVWNLMERSLKPHELE